jgi:hypothetical protein
MVKVIAFYEDHWMPPGTDKAQWDHLCRAYGVDLQMVRTWEEAEISPEETVAIVDEAGSSYQVNNLKSIPNCVLVFGRSNQDLTTCIPDYDLSVRIQTPRDVSMFGVSAAAIILDRFLGES